jgi:thiol-disulfide isomerase/thioredoxin
MKRSLVYGFIILVCVGLGTLLIQDLRDVAQSQRNQAAFEQRTERMTRSAPNRIRRSSPTFESLSSATRRYIRDLGLRPASLSHPERISFRLKNMAGREISYKMFNNQWILLNFWATWCPPCRFEMPSFQQLHETFRDRPFSVVAINLQENRDQIRSFVDSMDLTFPILLDREGTVANRFYVTGVPETWLIAPGGRPVAKMNGSRDWNGKNVIELVRKLLEQRPSSNPRRSK